MRVLDPTNPADVLVARRSLTRLDPMAFALRYLRAHITDDLGRVTFAECHREWCALAARSWTKPPSGVPETERFAFFAPRNTGKSTWWLLILPMWAAAHGWSRFAAIFADSSPQAKMHLETFRKELRTNDLLRQDFPELCAPAMRSKGRSESDRQDMIVQANGFVMTARGMDSSSLGMKVSEKRPDLLLVDDPEPDEANYSVYQMEQRRSTFTDAVLPLNIFARLVYSGTVTMPDSIAHQMVRVAKGQAQAEDEWVTEAHIRVRHSEPVRTDPATGRQRSLWPERWSLAYLQSIMHTRSYAKNYANDPRGSDGGYWGPAAFRYEPGDNPVKAVIQIDPAVTAKKGSDYTGIAVVSYDPYAPGSPPPVRDRKTKKIICQGRVTLHHVQQYKVTPGDDLVKVVSGLVAEFPFVGGIAVESNQGGETWLKILREVGLPIVVEPATVAKEVRAADSLHHFEFGRVVLAHPMPEYETQACAFPRAPHDDMVDCANAGVLRYLSPLARKVASEGTENPR